MFIKNELETRIKKSSPGHLLVQHHLVVVDLAAVSVLVVAVCIVLGVAAVSVLVVLTVLGVAAVPVRLVQQLVQVLHGWILESYSIARHYDGICTQLEPMPEPEQCVVSCHWIESCDR